MGTNREQELREFYKNDEYKIALHKEHLNEWIYNYWQYKPTKELEMCLDLLADEEDSTYNASLIFCTQEGLMLWYEDSYPVLMDVDSVAFEFRYRNITVGQFGDLLDEFVCLYYDLEDEGFFVQVKDISDGWVSFETVVGDDTLKGRILIGDIVIGVTGNKHLMM